MPVMVGCPSCNIKLEIPEHLLGSKVRCATCQIVFEATADAAPPPSHASREVTFELPREDERPRTRPRPRREYWDEDDDLRDDYDDRDERRYRRRDLKPHRGGAILTLGILSTVLPFACSFIGVIAALIMGPMAWIMGSGDLAQMTSGHMDPDGHGTTRAGQICGMVGTAFGVLAIVCCTGYFAVIISNPKFFK